MRQWRAHQFALATVLSVGLTVVAAAPAAVPNALAGPAESPGPDSAVVVKTWGLPPVLPVFSCAGGPVLLAPTKPLATEPSDYYAIELVPTGRVPGTRLSSGVAYSTAALSPFFGVALAPTGEYYTTLRFRLRALRLRGPGPTLPGLRTRKSVKLSGLANLMKTFMPVGRQPGTSFW